MRTEVFPLDLAQNKIGVGIAVGHAVHQISALPAATCAAVEHEQGACRAKQPPTATDCGLEDRIQNTRAYP